MGENCEERVDSGELAEHRVFSGESVLGKSSWRFEVCLNKLFLYHGPVWQSSEACGPLLRVTF